MSAAPRKASQEMRQSRGAGREIQELLAVKTSGGPRVSHPLLIAVDVYDFLFRQIYLLQAQEPEAL